MPDQAKKDKAKLVAWKIDLEDTINGDPDLPACALNVVRVYLHFLTEENPHPFCAMSKLMAKTNLSEPTIKRARAKLISLGYMVAKGASAGKGATQYELRNPRRDLVQQLVTEREAELQKASGEKRKADARQSKRDQNFTPSNDVDESLDQGSKFTPHRDQNLPTTGVKNDPLSTVEITLENTVEGAAQAATHQGRDDNLDSGGAALAYASRPLSGGEEPPPFDGEVEEQPDWIAEIPMPNSLDDYLGCGIAEDEFVGGQKSPTSADAYDDEADASEIDDAELDADQLAAWRSLDACWADDADEGDSEFVDEVAAIHDDKTTKRLAQQEVTP